MEGDVIKVTSLLRSGADVNVKGNEGQTPLDLADIENYETAVRLLGYMGEYDVIRLGQGPTTEEVESNARVELLPGDDVDVSGNEKGSRLGLLRLGCISRDFSLL
tara:strand:- start:55 stop:369 length:315 start_codon:yes stop_codon:yes gene_type:complete